MFSHVMVGANDLDASRKFYDAVLGTIGIPAGVTDEKGRLFYLRRRGSSPSRSRSTVLRPPPPTAGRSGLPSRIRPAWTPGMRLASPTAGRPARILRACAKAAWGRCISPTCGIRPATSFAPFTAWAERNASHRSSCASLTMRALPVRASALVRAALAFHVRFAVRGPCTKKSRIVQPTVWTPSRTA